MGNGIVPMGLLVNQPAPPVNTDLFKEDLDPGGHLLVLLADLRLGGAGSIIDLRCRAKGGKKATGTITVVPGADLLNGVDTVTINDGYGHTVVFTYRTAAPLINDILFAAGSSAADVAINTRDKINAHPFLGVIAVVDRDNPALLNITSRKAAADGNQAIVEAVANANYVVTGMAGGLGGVAFTTPEIVQAAIGNNQVDRVATLVGGEFFYNLRLQASVAITYAAAGGAKTL
jgi:hypothetical protein